MGALAIGALGIGASPSHAIVPTAPITTGLTNQLQAQIQLKQAQAAIRQAELDARKQKAADAKRAAAFETAKAQVLAVTSASTETQSAVAGKVDVNSYIKP